MHALEKEMATHSSVLAWRIPVMGEPGGLPSVGSHRVGHDWSDSAAAAAASAAHFSLGLTGSTASSYPSFQWIEMCPWVEVSAPSLLYHSQPQVAIGCGSLSERTSMAYHYNYCDSLCPESLWLSLSVRPSLILLFKIAHQCPEQ